MEKLKIGVIGAGGIARRIHLPALMEAGAAQVAAVCDCIGEKASALAEQFHIPREYVSYHEMLEKEPLDAVYVLTQPDQLYRIAVDCLKKGKHVFMEKPMGITLYQAENIRAQALQAGRCVHVGYNRRYIPLVAETMRRMRQLTEINHVSGCFYKDSSPSFYGGCASAFECDVIHVIDLLRHAAGCRRAVSAHTLAAAPQDGGPAYAWYSVFQFENGVSADLRANYQTGGRVHQFELHGAKASAYISLGFGGAQCEARILCSSGSGSHSQSVNGKSNMTEIRLDGRELAGSDVYWRYYGYYDETLAFLRRVQEHPQETDADRLEEDVASVRLMQMLSQAAGKENAWEKGGMVTC